MKKILLFLTLINLTTSAFAELAKVTQINDETIYIKTDSIKRNGQIIAFWQLSDFMSAQSLEKINLQYLSYYAKNEINCETNELRLLGVTFYSMNLAQGVVVTTFKYQNDFDYIIPNSQGEKISKFVCGKK